MVPSSRPRSTASLSALPTELLSQIAQHLDRPSAVAFGLTARRFTIPSESAIWRELSLSLHPSYGEYPLVHPYAPGDDAYSDWVKAEANRAEDRRREGLRRKIKQTMVAMSARRLGMVQKIVVVPREGSMSGIISILDMVSDNLVALEIQGLATNYYSHTWWPVDIETLDLKWVNSGLYFPSLTHLYIRQDSVRFAEFIVVLCHAAPNLTHLDCDATDVMVGPDTGAANGMIPEYPKYKLDPTRLQFLRLVVSQYGGAELAPPSLVSLIDASPLLRQASISDHSNTGDDPLILKALASLGQLCDLHINSHLEEIVLALNDRIGISFPSLRRFVVYQGEPFMFYMPSLPLLEALYLIPWWSTADHRPAATSFSEPTERLSRIPGFAAGLCNSPRLRSIYQLPSEIADGEIGIFDQLEAYAQAEAQTGVIRSLRHGGEELIHARLLLHHFEVSDGPSPNRLSDRTRDVERMEYQAEDGTQRVRNYATRAGEEGAWQDYIEYDGCMVPAEILQKMRLAAGAKVGEWEGRQVEVGAEAWAVLTGWRDAEVIKEQGGVAV